MHSRARIELRRQNVKDLPSTITVADALGDFQLGQEDSNFSFMFKHKNKGKATKWKKKENEKGDVVGDNANKKEKQSARTSKKGEQSGKFDGCFLCKGLIWQEIGAA